MLIMQFLVYPLVDSKPVPAQDSVKPSGAQPSLKPQTVTSVNSTDSQDDDGMYKYPPLKATKAGGQTDDDHEEKNTGFKKSKTQQQISAAKSGEDVSQSTRLSTSEGTSDIASSFGESEDGSTDKPQEESLLEKKKGADGKDTEARKDSVATEDTEDETRKQILMYLSSDVSDKQSDLDDGSGNVTESAELKGNRTSQQEEKTSNGTVKLDQKSSKGEKTSDAAARPLDEEEADQGLILLCVSK